MDCLIRFTVFVGRLFCGYVVCYLFDWWRVRLAACMVDCLNDCLLESLVDDFVVCLFGCLSY